MSTSRPLLVAGVLVVPLVTSMSSRAQPADCPAAPAATQDIPRSPRELQARLDTKANPPLPTNGRPRVRSLVGPPAEVPVRLLVDGHPAAYDRAVDDGEIELTPRTPLPPSAKVVVEVDGIASATYPVGPRADRAAPVLSNARETRIATNVPGPVCPGPVPPADHVDLTLDVVDESLVRVRVRLVRASGEEVAPQVAVLERSRSSTGVWSRQGIVFARFAAGTLHPGEHAALRVEAIDAAGNAAAPLSVDVVAPRAAVDAGAAVDAVDAGSPPPPRGRRGCG